MRRGFTLVELSIVLVIIGIIIGGILTAKSMIQSARMNSVIREISALEYEVHKFRDIYKYLPGDLPNTASLIPSKCASPDGNGDQLISNASGNAFADLRLGLGETPDIKYPSCSANCFGYANSCGSAYWHEPGVDVPKSKAWPNMGYYLYYHHSWANTPAGLAVGSDVNYIQVGTAVGSISGGLGASFDGITAKAFDSKIDDADVDAGRMQGGYAWGNCWQNNGGWVFVGDAPACVFAIRWGLFPDRLALPRS